jgi:hypothetical protein
VEGVLEALWIGTVNGFLLKNAIRRKIVQLFFDRKKKPTLNSTNVYE